MNTNEIVQNVGATIPILATILSILASTLRLATPLILASLGGVFSEKSGVVNIALEGIMINGAFFAVLIAFFTGMPWLAVIGAGLAGVLTALLLGVMSIKFKANQVVVGVAINLLAASLTAFLLEIVWKRSGQTDSVPNALTTPIFDFVKDIPLLQDLNPFVYMAIIAVVITYFVLYKTPFGLRVRAVGEHPKAADALGINVFKIRYICVMISGFLAGVAGASLSIGIISSFREGMVAGKGFIALAAVIFGKWHPIGALGASLFFGLTEAIQINAQVIGLGFIPVEILKIFPYLATILALVGVVGKSLAPTADGIPYDKQE